MSLSMHDLLKKEAVFIEPELPRIRGLLQMRLRRDLLDGVVAETNDFLARGGHKLSLALHYVDVTGGIRETLSDEGWADVHFVLANKRKPSNPGLWLTISPHFSDPRETCTGGGKYRKSIMVLVRQTELIAADEKSKARRYGHYHRINAKTLIAPVSGSMAFSWPDKRAQIIELHSINGSAQGDVRFLTDPETQSWIRRVLSGPIYDVFIRQLSLEGQL